MWYLNWFWDVLRLFHCQRLALRRAELHLMAIAFTKDAGDPERGLDKALLSDCHGSMLQPVSAEDKEHTPNNVRGRHTTPSSPEVPCCQLRSWYSRSESEFLLPEVLQAPWLILAADISPFCSFKILKTCFVRQRPTQSLSPVLLCHCIFAHVLGSSWFQSSAG